jgi:hypothetical protein
VWSSLIAAAFKNFVSEEGQERHHNSRHSAATAAAAGPTLAARAILHALDDIT